MNNLNVFDQDGKELHIAGVISRFFEEMAEKHNVKIVELNLRIEEKKFRVEQFVYSVYPEFIPLEIIDLDGL